jgi:hypothetical protein
MAGLGPGMTEYDAAPMRGPRQQFFGRAADGVPDRARAGRADHGEADKEAGGGDGGGGCVMAFPRLILRRPRNAAVSKDGRPHEPLTSRSAKRIQKLQARSA